MSPEKIAAAAMKDWWRAKDALPPGYVVIDALAAAGYEVVRLEQIAQQRSALDLVDRMIAVTREPA